MDMAYITFQNSFNSEEMTHIHLHMLDRVNIHKDIYYGNTLLLRTDKGVEKYVFCSINCPRGAVTSEGS